jgi:hypothetical protein
MKAAGGSLLLSSEAKARDPLTGAPFQIAPPQSGNSGSARLGRGFAFDLRGAPPASTNRRATTSECFMLQQLASAGRPGHSQA